MPQPSSPALYGALESLDATLALALALRQAGRSIDLEGLDAEVTALCAAVLSLPTRQRQDFGLGLRGLQARIGALQASL